MKFKIGDILKRNDKPNDEYTVTSNKGLYKVVSIINGSYVNNIEVEVIKHNYSDYLNNKYVVNSGYFDLYKRLTRLPEWF